MTGGKYDLSHLTTPKTTGNTEVDTQVASQQSHSLLFKKQHNPEWYQSFDNQKHNDIATRVQKSIEDADSQYSATQKALSDNKKTQQQLIAQSQDPNTTPEQRNQIKDQFDKIQRDNIYTDATAKNLKVQQLKLNKEKADLLQAKSNAEDIAYNNEYHPLDSGYNFLANAWNSFIPNAVSGVGALVQTAGDYSQLATGGAGNVLFYNVVKKEAEKIQDPKKKDQVLKVAKDFQHMSTALTNYIGGGLQDVGKSLEANTEDAHPEKHQIAGMLGGLVGNVAQIALGTEELSLAEKGAKVLTAASFGLGAANTSYDEATNKGLTGIDRDNFVMANTIANAALVTLPAGKLIDKAFSNTMVKDVVAESLDKIKEKGLTGTAIFDEVTKTFKEKGAILAKHVLTNAAKSSAEGAAFGAATGLTELGIKQVANTSLGKDTFEVDPNSVWESTKMMALGGGLMGTVLGGTGLKGIDKSFYDKVVSINDNPYDLKQFNELLDAKVKAGEIKPEEAQNITQNIKAINEVNKTIPKTVTDKSKRIEAINIITKRDDVQKENNQLQAQLANIDPAMSGELKDRIRLNANKINSANSDLGYISKESQFKNFLGGIDNEEHLNNFQDYITNLDKNSPKLTDEIAKKRTELQNTPEAIEKRTKEEKAKTEKLAGEEKAKVLDDLNDQITVLEAQKEGKSPDGVDIINEQLQPLKKQQKVLESEIKRTENIAPTEEVKKEKVDFKQKEISNGINNISDESGDVFTSVKEFVSGLTDSEGGNGKSKYHPTNLEINGENPKIRVSDHSGNFEPNDQYTISLVVDKDFNKLNVEHGDNYTEIRIPDNAKDLNENIDNIIYEIENIPKEQFTKNKPKIVEVKKEDVKLIEPFIKGSRDYHKGKTSDVIAKEKGFEPTSEHEQQRFIAENSENPLEIAKAYIDEHNKQEKLVSDSGEKIANANIQLTEDQFRKIGDINNLTLDVRRRFIREKPKVNYDSTLSSLGLEPEDFVDYVRRQNPALKISETPLKTKLKNKFADLTGGKDLTPERATRIIEAENKRQERLYEDAVEKENAKIADEETKKAELLNQGEISYDENGDVKTISSEPINKNKGTQKELDALNSINESDLTDAQRERKAELDSQLGVTHAKIKARRIADDLVPIEKMMKEGNEERWNRVVFEVENGEVVPENIIDRINTSDNKSASADEVAAMAYHMIDLQNQKGNIESKIEVVQKDGGDATKLLVKLDALHGEINYTDQALIDSGSEGGKSLQFRQRLYDREFSMVGIERLWKIEQNGKELTDRQKELAKNLSSQIEIMTKDLKDKTALRDKVKTENKENAEKEYFDKVKRGEIKEPKKISESQKKIRKVKTDIDNLWKEFDTINDSNKGPVREGLGIKTEHIKVLAKIALKHIELGGMNIAEVSKQLTGEVKKRLGIKLSKEDLDKIFNEEVDGKKVGDQFENVDNTDKFNALAKQVGVESEGELHEGLKPLLSKMFKMKVEEGATDYKTVIDDIHSAIEEHIPGLDKEKLRDLISGYGEFRELSKDAITRQVAELKNQARLDAKLEATERNELPLRNGLQRAEKTAETRAKEKQIAKNIKEKNLVPDLTDSEKEGQFKSALENHHRRLETAIEDVRKEIADGQRYAKAKGKEYNDPKSVSLKADLEMFRELRDKVIPKEKMTDEQRAVFAIKGLEKSIQSVMEGIHNLKNGKTETGEIYPEKTGQKKSVTNARIEELKQLKKGLEQEREDLLPQSVKDKALLDKYKKSRERRLTNLQDKLDRGDFEVKKRSPVPDNLTKEIDDLNTQIKRKEQEVKFEVDRIAEQNMNPVQKAARVLGKLVRFSIFLSLKGMEKLSLAAMFRPVIYPLENLMVGIASNAPAVKIFGKTLIDTQATLKKNPAMYQKQLFDYKSALVYYKALFNKETFKEAGRSFTRKGTNFDLLHGNEHDSKEGLLGVTSKKRLLTIFDKDITPEKIDKVAGAFFAKPQQAHGALKTGPKLARFAEAYHKSLNNLEDQGFSREDSRVQKLAAEYASAEGYADIFMNNSELSSIPNRTIEALKRSPEAYVQVLGSLFEQEMPVTKIPINFYLETMQKVPLVGAAHALSIIKWSGKKGQIEAGKFPGGRENLTQEQAHRASRAIISHMMGVSAVAVGVAIYKKYKEEAADLMDENKYYMHNTLTKSVISGMNIARDIEKYGYSFKKALLEEQGNIAKESTAELSPLQFGKKAEQVLTSESGVSNELKRLGKQIITPSIFKSDKPSELEQKREKLKEKLEESPEEKKKKLGEELRKKRQEMRLKIK